MLNEIENTFCVEISVNDIMEKTSLEQLDYLLDFACDAKILVLYKKVCRRHLYTYLSCIKFYIEAYREMWEDENE